MSEVRSRMASRKAGARKARARKDAAFCWRASLKWLKSEAAAIQPNDGRVHGPRLHRHAQPDAQRRLTSRAAIDTGAETEGCRCRWDCLDRHRRRRRHCRVTAGCVASHVARIQPCPAAILTTERRPTMCRTVPISAGGRLSDRRTYGSLAGRGGREEACERVLKATCGVANGSGHEVDTWGGRKREQSHVHRLRWP